VVVIPGKFWKKFAAQQKSVNSRFCHLNDVAAPL